MAGEERKSRCVCESKDKKFMVPSVYINSRKRERIDVFDN
jgi:hypothetical protein